MLAIYFSPGNFLFLLFAEDQDGRGLCQERETAKLPAANEAAVTNWKGEGPQDSLCVLEPRGRLGKVRTLSNKVNPPAFSWCLRARPCRRSTSITRKTFPEVACQSLI